MQFPLHSGEKLCYRAYDNSHRATLNFNIKTIDVKFAWKKRAHHKCAVDVKDSIREMSKHFKLSNTWLYLWWRSEISYRAITLGWLLDLYYMRIINSANRITWLYDGYRPLRLLFPGHLVLIRQSPDIFIESRLFH